MLTVSYAGRLRDPERDDCRRPYDSAQSISLTALLLFKGSLYAYPVLSRPFLMDSWPLLIYQYNGTGQRMTDPTRSMILGH